MVYFFTYTFTLSTKNRKTQYTFSFTLSLYQPNIVKHNIFFHSLSLYQPNTIKHNIFSLLQFIFSILILRLTTCDVLQRNNGNWVGSGWVDPTQLLLDPYNNQVDPTRLLYGSKIQTQTRPRLNRVDPTRPHLTRLLSLKFNFFTLFY